MPELTFVMLLLRFFALIRNESFFKPTRFRQSGTVPVYGSLYLSSGL